MTVDDRLVRADRLAIQLVRLVKLVDRAAGAHPSPTGIDRAAYRLLAVLVLDGPHRSTALAERVHSDPSTVSRQTAQLVRAGLVERHADPDDGRAARLGATALGRETFATHRAHRAALIADLTDDWSVADVDTFSALLDRFTTGLELRPGPLGAGPAPPPPPSPRPAVPATQTQEGPTR